MQLFAKHNTSIAITLGEDSSLLTGITNTSVKDTSTTQVLNIDHVILRLEPLGVYIHLYIHANVVIYVFACD